MKWQKLAIDNYLWINMQKHPVTLLNSLSKFISNVSFDFYYVKTCEL